MPFLLLNRPAKNYLLLFGYMVAALLRDIVRNSKLAEKHLRSTVLCMFLLIIVLEYLDMHLVLLLMQKPKKDFKKHFVVYCFVALFRVLYILVSETAPTVIELPYKHY